MDGWMPQKKSPQMNWRRAKAYRVPIMPWRRIPAPAKVKAAIITEKKPRRCPSQPQPGAAMAPAKPPREKTKPEMRARFSNSPAR